MHFIVSYIFDNIIQQTYALHIIQQQQHYTTHIVVQHCCMHNLKQQQDYTTNIHMDNKLCTNIIQQTVLKVYSIFLTII